MGFSSDMQIIEFDSFETAFSVQPGKESAVKRRFMTLFAQEDQQAQIGGTSYVCKAQSFTGETFAVKRLLANAGIPKGAAISPEDAARITQGHAAAFYEEYKNQLLVSQMRGFPKLFGYGMIGDDPAIVMEWVDGVSLRDVARRYAEEDRVVPAKTIAAIGVSVLEVLDTAARLDSALVHRDISPANIMIRTEDATFEEQVERGYFDICLIDFGSASAAAPNDSSFTMVYQVWRNGTPEYAPPEMLTQDIAHIDELRKSQAIDVFALCSVLYELYAGHTPWRVGEHPEISPFRIKTERAPEPVPLRRGSDAPLIDALTAGLHVEQASRPTVQELHATMLAFASPAVGGDAGSPLTRRTASGYAVLPSLYTPDSTHLKVAAVDEGGRRAGEDVVPFESPPSLVTRRSLVIGGAVLVAAVAGGAFAARSLTGTSAYRYDFSNYPTTDSVYSGDALYPVMRSDSSTWALRDVEAGAEIALGSGNREPGRFVAGLMRAYDPASGFYGFVTVVEDGGASGRSCAWRVLPRFAEAGDFSDPPSGGDRSATGRLAAVRESESGLWGYVNLDGDLTIAPAYTNAGRFSHGCAPVRVESGLWCAIDESGVRAFDARFIGLGVCSEGGLMAAAERSGRRWGFVDEFGEWAIPDEYAQVRRFSEGLAACKRGQDDLWGYVNEAGETVIEARFVDAFPFADGYAPALDPVTQLWGLIDTTGAWRVEPRYLSLGERTGGLMPAHGSPANVYDIEGADSAAWREYTKSSGDWSFEYGFINESGEWVVKPIYGDTLIRQPEQ